MISGVYFHICIADEYRDKWVEEFDTLLERIRVRCMVEDWEGQIDEKREGYLASREEADEDDEPEDEDDFDDCKEERTRLPEGCPFCETCSHEEICRHLVATGNSPTTFINGFDTVNEIHDLCVKYQEKYRLIDWKDCLDGLLLKEVTEEKRLDYFRPTEVLRQLPGVYVRERHLNLAEGGSCCFLHIYMNNEKLDDWREEFQTLLERVRERAASVDSQIH